jgi:hypothetical protein
MMCSRKRLATEQEAEFCDGEKIEVNAWNVAPLRCAGEVLEMPEECSEDNLISKTERFPSQSVLRSLNAEPWFQDSALLSLPFFDRVISTM